MARYTTDIIKSFGSARYSRVILAEGLVAINQWNGYSFISTGDTLEDSSAELVTQGLRLQFIVADGGAVTIEEGEYA